MTMTLADPFRILIVEDDDTLANLVKDRLLRYGYAPVCADLQDDVCEQLHNTGAQLVLMDVNLPRFDGFYWCRQIRRISEVPILFVSGREGSMDQVRALDGGADDYIVKPFHIEVLLAKIASLLRRAYGEYAKTPVAEPDREGPSHFVYDGLTLDPLRLCVGWEARSVHLTIQETRLLHVLLRAQGGVVTRATLLETLWDNERFVDDNTLSVNVSRVRKRLAELKAPFTVATARQLGYRLARQEGDE